MISTKEKPLRERLNYPKDTEDLIEIDPSLKIIHNEFLPRGSYEISYSPNHDKRTILITNSIKEKFNGDLKRIILSNGGFLGNLDHVKEEKLIPYKEFVNNLIEKDLRHKTASHFLPYLENKKIPSHRELTDLNKFLSRVNEQLPDENKIENLDEMIKHIKKHWMIDTNLLARALYRIDNGEEVTILDENDRMKDVLASCLEEKPKLKKHIKISYITDLTL